MTASLISLAAAALLTAADQLIKFFIERDLQPVMSADFINGFIGWKYVRNTGAAFGSFAQSTTLLSVFTGIVLLAGIVLILSGKLKNKYYLVCATLIVAGGLGNLLDRVFRGYVVDFIEVQFVNFAVFNFADILVTVGAFMLMGYLLYDTFRERSDKKKGENNG